METFDRYFGALAATATGSNTIIEQLADIMTTQYDKIAASIAKMKLKPPTTTTSTPRGTQSPLSSGERVNLNRRINQLQAAIKGK